MADEDYDMSSPLGAAAPRPTEPLHAAYAEGYGYASGAPQGGKEFAFLNNDNDRTAPALTQRDPNVQASGKMGSAGRGVPIGAMFGSGGAKESKSLFGSSFANAKPARDLVTGPSALPSDNGNMPPSSAPGARVDNRPTVKVSQESMPAVRPTALPAAGASDPGTKVSAAAVKDEPSTPVAIRTGITALQASLPGELQSLLAWRNPAQTIVVLGLCGLALAVIQFVASGGLGISLVEGVAYVLLARLAMGFVSATLGASSRDSAQVWDATIDWASSSLRSVCQGYETAIHNPNPHATLAFTLALWAVAVVGRVLRPHHVAWLVLGVAFAAAPAWARLHRVVKCGWSFAAEALDHQMEKMQITRGKRAVALVVALAFFWLYVGWVHRAVSLLVALELIRCQMTPQEAKSMMETVGPVVKKTVGDVTSVMKAWTPRGKTYMTPAPNQGSLNFGAAEEHPMFKTKGQ